MIRPAFADALDYLDGRVFGTADLCESLENDQWPTGDTVDQMLLLGRDGERSFQIVNYPGICRIDGILNPALFGRGSDLATAMVSVSCIDDVAVPDFAIMALEYWPDEGGEGARVEVYPVGQAGLDHLAGDYRECSPAARDVLSKRQSGG